MWPPPRSAMKNTLAVLVVLALTASVAGQSHHRGPRTRAVPVAAVSQTDLNATLTNLEHAAAATHSDISDMRIDKWGAGWKPGFLGKSSHVKEAEQTAVSIKRNLVGALPSLIGEVRTTHGNASVTFKLYDDLSVVCEALDSLLSATETYGKKEEYGPLAKDFSALTQIRRHLSSYIQIRTSAMEARNNATYASSSAPRRSSGAIRRKKTTTIAENDSSISLHSGTQLPKKIVVDDNVPEQKPAKKKAALQYSNL